jgi:DNA-binding CsgD family transcriptional regulator
MAQSPQLSNREQDVVNLLLEGKSNKLIASSLHISERTVEFHLKNIFDKYQVNSRVELVLKLGKSTGKKLGDSTVAGEGELTENRERPSSRDWVAPLREAVSIIGKELRMENMLNSKANSEADSSTFFGAIRVCLAKYADFNGRATRSEFWWFALFVTLATSALVYLSESLGSIFLIGMLLPFLAAGARRLYDMGKSGWWLLYMLVPVGGSVLLGYLWAMPTDEKL